MSIEAMKRYLIHTSVQGAEGFQTWYVDAKTKEEAMDKYRNGDSDIYASEVDVTSLGDPEIESTTTLDDFGDFGPAPQRQPLTDEQIEKLAEQVGMYIDKYGLAFDAENGLEDGVDVFGFARAIEAAHGIKGEA